MVCSKTVLMNLASLCCSLAIIMNTSISNFVGYCKDPELFGRAEKDAHIQDYSTGLEKE